MSETVRYESLDGQVLVAHLSGDIDVANAAWLETDILTAAGRDMIGLIVDLSGVRYLDSTGIQMLFTIIRRLHERRQVATVALAEDSPVRKLVKLTGLDDAVCLAPTVEECGEWVRARSGESY